VRTLLQLVAWRRGTGSLAGWFSRKRDIDDVVSGPCRMLGKDFAQERRTVPILPARSVSSQALAVKSISRSQWNDGYGADSGPSLIRRTLRSFETSPVGY
jgi:hypothetical protein